MVFRTDVLWRQGPGQCPALEQRVQDAYKTAWLTQTTDPHHSGGCLMTPKLNNVKHRNLGSGEPSTLSCFASVPHALLLDYRRTGAHVPYVLRHPLNSFLIKAAPKHLLLLRPTAIKTGGNPEHFEEKSKI